MKTRHKYTINYADTDASRHIRLCDLERYLLEAGGASADIMGFGTDYVLEKYNTAWVLTRLTVAMDYLPCYNDEVVIETWVETNAHMLSIRNYRIYLLKGDDEFLIGKSTSIWTLLNLTTRQVDVDAYNDSAWDGKVDGEKLDLPRAPRLGRIEEPSGTMPHTIRYTDLDYNQHCNSCKYLQFMLNACDALTTIYPIRLDINYVKEVHKGDTIAVDFAQSDNSVQYCILNPAGEVSCTAMLTKL